MKQNIHSLKKAVKKALPSAYAKAGLAVATVITTVEANATSYFDATTAATLTTDMTETTGDVMGWAWGIFAVVGVSWFAFNNSRKAAGKFGAR